jgi:hypothetical protein
MLNEEHDEKHIEHLYANYEFKRMLDPKKSFGISPSYQLHQLFTSQYMSPYRSNRGILVFHEMGTGKTCTASLISESHLAIKDGYIKRVYVIATSPNIIRNDYRMFSEVCITRYKSSTDLMKKHYRFMTLHAFVNMLQTEFKARLGEPDSWNIAKARMSESLFILDEAHNIASLANDSENSKYKYMYEWFQNMDSGNKVVLLSGTPMLNSPLDLIPLMNLILDKPIQESDLNPESRQELAMKLDGYISFYRKPNDPKFKRLYEGKPVAPSPEVIQVIDKYVPHGVRLYGDGMIKAVMCLMSPHQNQYHITIDQDTSGIFRQSMESSLWVFPDGSFGKVGEERNATWRCSSMDELYTCSTKYHYIISNIARSRQVALVYIEIKENGGAHRFVKVLEQVLGMRSFNPKDPSVSNKTYALLTGDTPKPYVRSVLSAMNSDDNKKGEIISVCIITKAFAEGITLRNVNQVYICTFHWNRSLVDQIIYRARPPLLSTTAHTVKVHQLLAYGSNYIKDYDYHVYMTALKKDIEIKFVERTLKEVAVDCMLHRRTTIRGYSDYSRECDYMQCNSLECRDDYETTDPEFDIYLRFYFDYDAFTDIAKSFFEKEWVCSVVGFREWLITKDIYLTLQEVLVGLGYIEYTQTIMKNPYNLPCVIVSRNDVFFASSIPYDASTSIINQSVSINVFKKQPDQVTKRHEERIIESMRQLESSMNPKIHLERIMSLLNSTNSSYYKEFILERVPAALIPSLVEYGFLQELPNIGLRSNIITTRFYKDGVWIDSTGVEQIEDIELKVDVDTMNRIGARGIYGKDKTTFMIQQFPVSKKHKGRVCKTLNKEDIVKYIKLLDTSAVISNMNKLKLCEVLYDLMQKYSIMVVQ